MLRNLPAVIGGLWLLAHGAVAATISGTVTDVSGKPIQNARVDHDVKQVVVGLGYTSSGTHTDADGHFKITTDVPAVVIRRPGYQSVRVLILQDADVKITLQPFRLPECKVDKLPEVKTMSVSDADYTEDIFSVETKYGRQGVRRGRGPMYSFGAPSDRDVWNSVDYFEVMSAGGEIDARGHTADGKYWRMKTFFGAATHYYGVDKETADILDCIIDKVI